MTDLVLADLAYLVTADERASVQRDVSVLVTGSTIGAIGPRDELLAGHPHAEVLDARGKLLLPGLVNLHTHLPMTLLRGLAEHVDLQGFLERVWAAEAAVMDPATVRLGATLGAVESLRGGTTTALDMYFHHVAAHEGAAAAGLRHVGGPVFFDGPGPDGLSWPERIAGLHAWPSELARIGGPQVPVAALPHGTYTNSPEHLAQVAAELATMTGDRLLCTHVSENAAENADVAQRYGTTPTALLAAAGWFDLDLPVVLAHGVQLSDADRSLAARDQVSVAHCPGSNLKLASGALSWTGYREAGVRLGLGTDGCSSSNDLDMWQVMRQAALLASHTAGDPAAVTAAQIVQAATIGGARALGLAGLTGSIEVGKQADLVLLGLDAPHLTPVHDVHALLVYAAGRGDVTDVLVAGEQVVRDGHSTRIDERELFARCRERGSAAAAAVAR